MKKIALITISILVFQSVITFAQSKKISGTVYFMDQTTLKFLDIKIPKWLAFNDGGPYSRLIINYNGENREIALNKMKYMKFQTISAPWRQRGVGEYQPYYYDVKEKILFETITGMVIETIIDTFQYFEVDIPDDLTGETRTKSISALRIENNKDGSKEFYLPIWKIEFDNVAPSTDAKLKTKSLKKRNKN